MEDMRSDSVTSAGRVSSAVYSAKTSTTAALVLALVLIALSVLVVLASAVLRNALTLVIELTVLVALASAVLRNLLTLVTEVPLVVIVDVVLTTLGARVGARVGAETAHTHCLYSCAPWSHSPVQEQFCAKP